jgi:hypothetical protein
MQCILGDEKISLLLKQSTMKNKLINHNSYNAHSKVLGDVSIDAPSISCK